MFNYSSKYVYDLNMVGKKKGQNEIKQNKTKNKFWSHCMILC